MKRIGLVLVLAVGILSTSSYGYQLPGRQFASKIIHKATSKSTIDEALTVDEAVNKVESLFTCTKDGLYPDPMNCNQFIQCSNARAFYMKCPSGLHFSRETERCESPEDAACDQNIQLSPREYDETDNFDEWKPRISILCSPDGLFASRESCTQYAECLHGRLIIRTCRPGLHFNKKTKKCDAPCNAKCDPNMSCSRQRPGSLLAETPVAEHITSSQSSRKFSKLKSAFVCSEDGLFSNPTDCSKYINCSNGNAYELSCPLSRHFNNVTKECETLCSVKCDPNLVCNWESSMVKIEEAYVDICNSTDDIFYVEHPNLCEVYYKCEGRELNKFRCRDALHFSNETSRCENPCDARCDKALARTCGFEVSTESEMVQMRFSCRKGRNFERRYLYECNYYFKCTDGDISVVHCPDGQHIKNKTFICEEPCVAGCDYTLAEECGWRNETTESEIAPTQMSPREENETDDFYEDMPGIVFTCNDGDFYPDHNDCNVFYECSQGTILKHTCFPGYHYNRKMDRCDTPCNAKCDPKISCPREKAGSLSTKTLADEHITSFESSKKFSTLKSAFVCSEDGLFPNPRNCSKYISCFDGIAYDLSCPPSRRFNNVTKECETLCSVKCDPNLDCDWQDNMKWEEGFYADICYYIIRSKIYTLVYEHDCGAYYLCEGGEMNKFRCPDGQHFNKNTSRCEDPCEAGCDPALASRCGFEQPTETIMRVSKMLCHKGQNFKRRFIYHCEYYFRCDDGEISVVHCPEGQQFIYNTYQCAEKCLARCDPYLAKECGWGNETTASENAPMEMSPREENETDDFYEDMSGIEFICDDGDFYPDHNDCNVFYECSQGKILKHTCFPGSHFNRRTNRCDTPCNAKCDPKLCVTTKTLAAEDRSPLSVSTDSSKKVIKHKFVCLADGLFPNRTDCSKYINCSNGNASEFSCPSSRHFNSVTKQCETFCSAKCDPNLTEQCGWGSSTESAIASPDTLMVQESHVTLTPFKSSTHLCSKDGTYLERNPLDCNTYFKCVDGEADLLYCPDGQHFNQQTLRCEDACDVECDSSKVLSNSLKQPIFDFQCPENGLYANTVCETFIQCSGGQAYLINCPFGQHYEPYSQRCTTPCEARCDPNYELYCEEEEKNKRRKLQHTQSSSAEQPFSAPKFICEHDGKYPDPEDCHNYITCRGGKSYPEECPDGLHFNAKIEICDLPCEAECLSSIACQCGWDWCDYEVDDYFELDCEAEIDKGPCRGFSLRYAYDSWTGRCKGFVYGGCGGNRNNFITMEECEDKCRKRLLREFRCPTNSGMFAHDLDCLSYYHCKGGIPTLKKCPKGKAFDHKKSKCVKESEATCLYECKDRDGMYQYEKKCQKYIHCINGIAKIEKCPYGKSFDPEKKDCIDAKQVKTCIYDWII